MDVSFVANKMCAHYSGYVAPATAERIDLPREAEQNEARTALRALAPLKRREPASLRLRSDGEDEVEVVIPARVFAVLLDILRHTAEGNAVTLVPVHAELTTQQAADLLNVSRPHIIKLLKGGEIPFHKTGRHRRILAKDLLDYRKRRAKESEDAFAELAAISQEHGGLGY